MYKGAPSRGLILGFQSLILGGLCCPEGVSPHLPAGYSPIRHYSWHQTQSKGSGQVWFVGLSGPPDALERCSLQPHQRPPQSGQTRGQLRGSQLEAAAAVNNPPARASSTSHLRPCMLSENRGGRVQTQLDPGTEAPQATSCHFPLLFSICSQLGSYSWGAAGHMNPLSHSSEGVSSPVPILVGSRHPYPN